MNNRISILEIPADLSKMLEFKRHLCILNSAHLSVLMMYAGVHSLLHTRARWGDKLFMELYSCLVWMGLCGCNEFRIAL